MKHRRLFWQLLPSYWVLISIAILAVAGYAFHSMASLNSEAKREDLTTRARLLSHHMAPLVAEKNTVAIQQQCKQLGQQTHTRFTVITPDGVVQGDSSHDPNDMENHSRRPEIRQALAGRVGIDRRFSRTTKQEMMYVAVPMEDKNGTIVCAMRASLPLNTVQEHLNNMAGRVLISALLTGLLAMGVCTFVVRRITKPLRGMSQAARQFATGDFQHRIPALETVELDQLSKSLNAMSEQLSKTLSMLSAQRNEQQAVLSSMDEGVLALDRRERIIHMNRVAGYILGKNHKEVKRLLLQEVVRHANLQEFIKATLGSQKPLSKDLVLRGEQEKQIQANGTILRNDNEESIGALIVLRDITQLRHLETVRSDFVANVSHELKTPITSIKGFVETLLGDDWEHDANTRRFLEIIQQQAERLNSIIDDLLMLSRLEQRDGKVLKGKDNLLEMLKNAMELCQLQAQKKQIHIVISCPNELELEMNTNLLEQAVVNLIVNAIKYSEPEKTIEISIEQHETNVMIHIQDEGFGIDHRHLDRLFERFYRVDTARSRKLGGTGLGLSIVKHIVQAHNGTISVKSKVAQGSTFTITLPFLNE